MNEAEARIVIRAMIRATALFNDELLELQPMMDAATFAAHKAQVAELMGVIAVDVLQGLYRQFPHLEPRDLAQWIEAGDLDAAHWLSRRPTTGTQI